MTVLTVRRQRYLARRAHRAARRAPAATVRPAVPPEQLLRVELHEARAALGRARSLTTAWADRVTRLERAVERAQERS